MEIDTEELTHIFVSVLAISLSLTFFSAPSLSSLTGKYFTSAMIVFTIAVGSGFLFHELMHRFVARKFGAWAGYRAWTEGLVLMLVLSILPFFTGIRFLFLAPGAVYIFARGRGISVPQNGIISVAGPITNIVLAAAFFIAFVSSCSFFPCTNLLKLGAGVDVFSFFDILSLPEKLAVIGLIGFSVNTQLALFNMIPIPPLDGSKVIAWDWRIWLLVAAIPFILTMVL